MFYGTHHHNGIMMWWTKFNCFKFTFIKSESTEMDKEIIHKRNKMKTTMAGPQNEQLKVKHIYTHSHSHIFIKVMKITRFCMCVCVRSFYSAQKSAQINHACCPKIKLMLRWKQNKAYATESGCFLDRFLLSRHTKNTMLRLCACVSCMG